MNLDPDPYAPLSEDEERAAGQPQAKAKPEKLPILPVPYDAPPLPDNFKIPGIGPVVAKWAYHDSTGRLLGYDARFEWQGEDGRRHKEVRPITYCSVGEKQSWRSKSFPTPRPLYGLDRLAERPTAPVVVAEGCKSADAAGALLPDYVAVAWQGGSNSTLQSDWAPLAGRKVLIWPDRDRHKIKGSEEEKPFAEQAGTITGEAIVQRLRGIAAEISVLDLADWNGDDVNDGWDAADAVSAAWTVEQAADFVNRRAQNVALATVTSLPFRYEYRADGLYYIESETKQIHICGRVNVLAKTRGFDGAGWGILIEWPDDDGVRHLWAMPKSMLSGDGGPIREALLDRGLFVNPENKARSKLLQFLAMADTDVRARSVTTVGWAGRCFALPHTTIGDSLNERVIFQHPEAPPHHYRSAGTLEDWKAKVAALATGNSRMVFAMSCAFAGPILSLTHEEGGGFNLVGGSSSGKTTCLHAGVSVWGPPGYMKTWRATGNGLEGVAAMHSETFLALDELGQLPPSEAGHVAYMLANGMGKARSKQTGSGRAVTTWKLVYLSTGEIGLSDLVKQDGRGKRTAAAGQEVRIVDLPADAEKGLGAFEVLNGGATTGAEFSRLIKTAAEECYGVPAERYIRALAEGWTVAGDYAANVIKKFIARHVLAGADGQVQRAARRFAVVAAAGELATSYDILPWAKGDAFRAAGTMFNAWLGRRGGSGSAEERNLISQVREFFENHAETRFDPADPDDRVDRFNRGDPREENRDRYFKPALNRVGFWKDIKKRSGVGYERIYLVMPESFKAVLIPGHDPKTAVEILEKHELLRSYTNHRVKMAGGLSTKYYAFGPEVFGGSGEALNEIQDG